MPQRNTRVIDCPECGRTRCHSARGLCGTCYARQRRNETPHMITCVDCGEYRPLQSRDRCNRCIQRAYRLGTVDLLVPWTPPTTPPVGPPTFGDPRLPQRFWDKVVVLDNGCWEWTGHVTEKGYGMWRVNDVVRQTHQVTYELLVGPIPSGLIADHTCHTLDLSCTKGIDCRHRRCCNPSTIELVTREENFRRAHVVRQTHCRRGHEYKDFKADGTGKCRICTNMRARELRKERRAFRDANSELSR